MKKLCNICGKHVFIGNRNQTIMCWRCWRAFRQQDDCTEEGRLLWAAQRARIFERRRQNVLNS